MGYVSSMSWNSNIWDVFWTKQAQIGQNIGEVASGRRVASAIRSHVNARDLRIHCARVLHETLFVPVLMYGWMTTVTIPLH